MSEKAVAQARPSTLATWVLAVRPRTLLASLTPVAVGTAAAAADGAWQPLAASSCALVALLLQVAANLANDAFDFERGIDTMERVGPVRVTQAGWLPVAHVRRAAFACVAAAAIPGAYLVGVAGTPVLLMGLAAMLAALAYSAGPYPLASHGLGEVSAFFFFGVLALCGTTWIQTGALSARAAIACLPVGTLVACIMLVNNLRDRESDAAVGKRTLVVRIGAAASHSLYSALVAGAFLAAIGLAAYTASPGPLLAFASLPLAWSAARRVVRGGSAADYDAGLTATAGTHAAFGWLLAIGMLW